jgi:anaerobic selenocysteine-containing dehydrogenase
MTGKISRAEFLKVLGASAAATAVLTGCGPASRYVEREPYPDMPEYTYNGESTHYASLCRECPAGCGIVVRTMQGRALKIEGNKHHPVNKGKTCSRGQAALQGLYNPDRIKSPLRQNGRGTGNFTDLTWQDAIKVVKDALGNNNPEEIAFFLGMASDHLFDLVTEITSTLSAPAPIRYGAYASFEARSTLAEATELLFDVSQVPYFDLANADVTFSFGANFLETYLSPVAYTRGFAHMRRGTPGRRGYLIQFESRLSQTAATADEWVPIKPGSEGLVALALGRLVAELSAVTVPPAYAEVNVPEIAGKSGVPGERLQELAQILYAAEHPLAIPGSTAMGHTNGLEAAQAILTLNALVGNIGKPGGVYITPALPVHERNSRLPNTFSEIFDLVNRMKAGEVKVLFVHGVNPVFELPSTLGFMEALERIPLIISFASFPDETAHHADFIFPDHTGLEAWGYQKVITGSEQLVISGGQPVVVPFYDTHSTSDVFLSAIQEIGGSLAEKVPYKDEVEFLQESVLGLIAETGYFNAPEIRTFWANWQQFGGWWTQDAGIEPPAYGEVLNRTLPTVEAEFAGDAEFHLLPFLSPILGDGAGANKPWLQETPDPMTTVMWNTWVEIHPETAEKLHVVDDDLVRVISPYGEIEASVYIYPAIHPETIAIPFGQGHTAYGRYAEGRGANPAEILGLKFNSAGDLAYASTKVRIETTGHKMELSRLESRMGVYGEEGEHEEEHS